MTTAAIYSIPLRDVPGANINPSDSCDGSVSSGRVTPLHQNTTSDPIDNGNDKKLVDSTTGLNLEILHVEQRQIEGVILDTYQKGFLDKCKGSSHASDKESTVSSARSGSSFGTLQCSNLKSTSPKRSAIGQVSVAEDWNPMVHAQSLLLGVAFACVWSPQNLMAPNLTQMGDFFHYSPAQRDLYLGSNIFFATAVLSLPISGVIGLYADIVSSRKRLYAYTIICGGIASIVSGSTSSYTVLYWARFLNGGCMAGSVPVAFSLLGDLFHTKHRNAASSVLTSMMGAGIIFGQVYSGTVGNKYGWQHPFFVCGIICIISAIMCLVFVEDPIRGGKEAVLQEIIRKGGQYDRKLTWEGFKNSMRTNRSNRIIMWQGFFGSVPWGIIFCFLNDYLSQEQGLSVPNATYLVMVFGVGCAFGGILGGWIGQETTSMNRSYMPIFMSVSTLLGIFPFMWILNATYSSASLLPCFFSFLSGCIASLPSVNIRPVLINVNPPESRGATLTAANLIINTARGVGPSFVTAIIAFGYTREDAFNFLIIFFWVITSIQLLYLAKTLPLDQDQMENELKKYADSICGQRKSMSVDSFDEDDLASIVSIEDRMTAFDQHAARDSLNFVREAIMEIGGRSQSGIIGMDHCDASEASSMPEVSWSPPNSRGYGSTYDFIRGQDALNIDNRPNPDWQIGSQSSLPNLV